MTRSQAVGAQDAPRDEQDHEARAAVEHPRIDRLAAEHPSPSQTVSASPDRPRRTAHERPGRGRDRREASAAASPPTRASDAPLLTRRASYISGPRQLIYQCATSLSRIRVRRPRPRSERWQPSPPRAAGLTRPPEAPCPFRPRAGAPANERSVTRLPLLAHCHSEVDREAEPLTVRCRSRAPDFRRPAPGSAARRPSTSWLAAVGGAGGRGGSSPRPIRACALRPWRSFARLARDHVRARPGRTAAALVHGAAAVRGPARRALREREQTPASPSISWRNEPASSAAVPEAQLLAPAVVGLPAVCLAWNAEIRSAISCAWVVSAKWPVSRRWSSASGRSVR